MPNYIITSGAKYDPFTYGELAAPLISITKARNELEDAYGELEAEASVWDKLKNNPQDAEVYNQYKAYSDDLKAQADALMREGLTPTSRRNLSKMKARYKAEINPIEEAWNKRDADIKDYKTQLTKDPTLLSGDTNPMNASLTSYMNGNTPNYRYLSGDDLYKQGLTAATALSKGKYNESKPMLEAGRQYWKMITKQGYSPDEAAQWLANNGAFPEITAEVNRIKEAYNTAGLGSNSAVADSQIIRGIMDGLHAGYKKDVDRQINRSFNNNPTDKGIFYDETGQGWKTIGQKLYKVNKEGRFELDDKGMPITLKPNSDKPETTTGTFVSMDKVPEDAFARDQEGKIIGHHLQPLLGSEKGKFKHIGTMAATVNNWDNELHDQLYLFNGDSKRELDYISNKKARKTSSLIVDPNSGELKQYDDTNTGEFDDVVFKPLSVDDLIARAEATEPILVEKYANGNSYKVYKDSPLGKLLSKVATSTLAKSIKDGEEGYYHLNQKEWDSFINSNLLFLEAPNKRKGLNHEGTAMSDILILQQQ